MPSPAQPSAKRRAVSNLKPPIADQPAAETLIYHVPGELFHGMELGGHDIMSLLASCTQLRNILLGTYKQLKLRFAIPLINPGQSLAILRLASAAPMGHLTLQLHGAPDLRYNTKVSPGKRLLELGNYRAITGVELKSLYLDGLVPTFLKKCGNLESLSLDNCMIQSLNAELKTPLTHLKHLTVSATTTKRPLGSFTQDQWARHLAKMPNLQQVASDHDGFVFMQHHAAALLNATVRSITCAYEGADLSQLPLPDVRIVAGGFTELRAIHLPGVIITGPMVVALLTIPQLSTVSCRQFKLGDNTYQHHQRWSELTVGSISPEDYPKLPLTADAVIHADTVVLTSDPEQQHSTEQLSAAVKSCSNVTLDCQVDPAGDQGVAAAAAAMVEDGRQRAAVLEAVGLFRPAKFTVSKVKSVRWRLAGAMYALPTSVTHVEYQGCGLEENSGGLILPSLPVWVESVRIVGKLSGEAAVKICQHPANHIVTVMFSSAGTNGWGAGWLKELRGLAHSQVSVEFR